jgi:hypothetical protein
MLIQLYIPDYESDWLNGTHIFNSYFYNGIKGNNLCATSCCFFGLEQQNNSAGFYLWNKRRAVHLKPTSVSEEHIAPVFTVEV